MSIPNTLERDQVCHCERPTIVLARHDKPWLNELAELAPRHHDDGCPLFSDDSHAMSDNEQEHVF